VFGGFDRPKETHHRTRSGIATHDPMHRRMGLFVLESGLHSERKQVNFSSFRLDIFYYAEF
jgi:hypothetical protein